MNYGGMALEGLWRGMDFANQQRAQQQAMKQQEFQNMLALKQMNAQQEQWAFERQRYNDEMEESRRKLRQKDIEQAFEMLDRGAPTEMVFSIYGPDILPQAAAQNFAGNAKNRIQRAMDIDLYKEGLRRVQPSYFEDKEAGMSIAPPPDQLYIGDIPVVKIPEKLPQQPVEYMTDVSGNIIALPKSLMPGQVPAPIDTGIKARTDGPGGVHSTAEMKNFQFLTTNLGLNQDDAMAIAYGIKSNGEQLSVSERARIAQGVARPIEETVLKMKEQLAWLPPQNRSAVEAEIQKLEKRLKVYQSIVDSSLNIGGDKGEGEGWVKTPDGVEYRPIRP